MRVCRGGRNCTAIARTTKTVARTSLSLATLDLKRAQAWVNA